jgi:hypothetical protein
VRDGANELRIGGCDKEGRELKRDAVAQALGEDSEDLIDTAALTDQQ